MGFCPLTYLNTEKLYQVYIFFSLGFLLGVYLVHAPPCCPGLAHGCVRSSGVSRKCFAVYPGMGIYLRFQVFSAGPLIVCCYFLTTNLFEVISTVSGRFSRRTSPSYIVFGEMPLRNVFTGGNICCSQLTSSFSNYLSLKHTFICSGASGGPWKTNIRASPASRGKVACEGADTPTYAENERNIEATEPVFIR